MSPAKRPACNHRGTEYVEEAHLPTCFTGSFHFLLYPLPPHQQQSLLPPKQVHGTKSCPALGSRGGSARLPALEGVPGASSMTLAAPTAVARR